MYRVSYVSVTRCVTGAHAGEPWIILRRFSRYIVIEQKNRASFTCPSIAQVQLRLVPPHLAVRPTWRTKTCDCVSSRLSSKS